MKGKGFSFQGCPHGPACGVVICMNALFPVQTLPGRYLSFQSSLLALYLYPLPMLIPKAIELATFECQNLL